MNYFAKENPVERVHESVDLVHHAPGVATLGRTAVGHRRLTGIGLQWPGDHRGLAGSERENWGTRLRRRLGAGSPELAGRWR
jgi:hypothetical protein